MWQPFDATLVEYRHGFVEKCSQEIERNVVWYSIFSFCIELAPNISTKTNVVSEVFKFRQIEDN